MSWREARGWMHFVRFLRTSWSRESTENVRNYRPTSHPSESGRSNCAGMNVSLGITLPRNPTNKRVFLVGGKCSSSDSSEEEFEPHEDCSLEELSQKMAHPQRLHPDLWHNEPGEINDGPLCRCSIKSRRTGIRHGIYPGEKGFPKCNPNSNNAERLYHYRITISPPTNFLTKTPTIIKHDQHEFIFEGFSLLSHVRIGEFPTCKVSFESEVEVFLRPRTVCR